MPRWKFELANVLSALIWTAWAVGIGAVSGQMIEPNGGWLPIGLIVVPAITIGISALIVHLRKPQR
jgi:membrane protein DedA with SNARE-associated domain